MANILGLANYVQQQGELGRARGTEQRLNRLAGQAVAAPDPQARNQFVQQAVATDPQSGFALQDRIQRQDDTRAQKSANVARYMLKAVESGNPAMIEGTYRAVRPFLQEIAPDREVPESWSPEMAAQLHQAVAASGNSALTNPYEGLPADIQSLRLLQDNPQLAALDRERRQAAGMVPKQIQTSQGWGWGTPGGGIELAPITGIAGQGGQLPPPPQVARAPQLFAALGQKYGIRPTSVTRTPERNREVGGVANSYHLTGQAADWAVPQAYKAQFMADARANGFEAIDEGDHIHIEPAGASRGSGAAPRLTVMDPVNGGIAQPYQAPPSAIEQERLRLAQNADARAAAAAQQRQNKPMPPAIFKQREATLAEAETAEGINQNLDKHLQRMDRGELEFGPIANRLAEARNFAGMSDAGSRNFAEFRSDLEKLRNDSLRLNAGVQTDGDAQRAWNELFSNINDTAYVKQRLRTIRQLNERAEMLKRASVERLDQEYGGGGSAQPTTDDDEALIGKYL